MTDREAKKHLNETLVTAFMKAHPDWPVQYMPRKYETTKTNGLTQAIIAYLKAKGHQAERISTTGRMIDRSKTFSDVVGYRRTVGSMEYIKGTGTKGSADISAIVRTYKGIVIPLKIEIKNHATHDRQSEAQKKYQADVERSGGVYMIARTLAQFLEDFETLVNW